MDILDCTVTHIWLLTGRRLSSCLVETSHTELHRCLISPNETGSPPMTTSRQSPARRSRKSRTRSGKAFVGLTVLLSERINLLHSDNNNNYTRPTTTITTTTTTTTRPFPSIIRKSPKNLKLQTSYGCQGRLKVIQILVYRHNSTSPTCAK